MYPHRHHRWLSTTGHATDTAAYVTPHRDGGKVRDRPTLGRFEPDYQCVEASEQPARLAGAKQAFLFRSGAVSTRLSHSRSVAAIAATIATAAGLNEAPNMTPLRTLRTPEATRATSAITTIGVTMGPTRERRCFILVMVGWCGGREWLIS